MFEKILIANRGEIACRIIRTAKRLGIRTVAVYSDVDIDAMHVAMADEAYHIGPAPAAKSYLIPEFIIDAARQSNCQAIHPGYGFLSENADFADACIKAGFVFIGPPSAAIRDMGSKSAAKRIMEKAVVPIIPGYHGEDQSPELLRESALQIGYPVVIKAIAGGGGKGMRVVREETGFFDALAAARREALASFNNDHVILEKYLTGPRHIEIQIFADSLGNIIHLFERDCSIQRRHQKVIEEAPASGINDELRAKIGAAAVAAARAIGYVGAGTVEFLLDEDGSFYFMEMNTRLQVEHPVTEMITGQDLVEWQLLVAAGEELPCRQEELTIRGHAIEARIYAEDPFRDFLPFTGDLIHLRTPQESAHIRIDTGVRQGDEVSIHYDPMIAKLIVWDIDRAGALRWLKIALADYQIAGVTTNLEFLSAVAVHPSFTTGDINTGFIETHKSLFLEPKPASDHVLALACLEALLRRTDDAKQAAYASFDPWSPWHLTTGWQMNSDNSHILTFLDGDLTVSITVHYRPDGYLLELPEGSLFVHGTLDNNGDMLAEIGGARIKATIVRQFNDLTILTHGSSHKLTLYDPMANVGEHEEECGQLTAPMPGNILAVLVETDVLVKRGTPLIIMEAMKMEHTITAPMDGMVTEFYFSVGAVVNEDTVLLAFIAEEDDNNEK